MHSVLQFYIKYFCTVKVRDDNLFNFRFVCLRFIPGVQTPDGPEGTEEGQREEQTQCWAAESQHYHV